MTDCVGVCYPFVNVIAFKNPVMVVCVLQLTILDVEAMLIN